ncbi:hypothetical protein [Rhizobium sp. BK176]|uniref:hypothetical protein n=1 Tax=Rhizobium sp. BK176 TaxID=2587071 RepID=UPI002169ECF4|nr:hypothetical protein [Rhizobium sp. BK176]MCS4090120.1 hypothetical protein [Rhizobium sp. BK176]
MTTEPYAQVGTAEDYERLEGICTERAIAQWRQSMSRADLDEEARVRGAIEAYKRQAFAGSVMQDHRAEQASSKPIVAVQTMRLSDGLADHYVSIKVDDRQVHPHVFRQEYKAAYHVALYDWLLNGGTEPDLLAFDEGDWPAQTTVLVAADPTDASTGPGLSQAFTVKPLEWVDEPSMFDEEGPTAAEAVGAGYTYRAEVEGGETLAARKLEAEGRYLHNVFDSLVPLTPVTDAASLGYAAIHAHTVRMAAHRSEENGDGHLAEQLRNAMRFIEHVAAKHPETI